MEPKLPETPPTERVHLDVDTKVDLANACLAAVKGALLVIASNFPPPICPHCVQRAAAVACAQTMTELAAVCIETLPEMNQFIDIVLAQLAEAFLKAEERRAQGATTTPPDAVH